jgi:hypothetical protein
VDRTAWSVSGPCRTSPTPPNTLPHEELLSKLKYLTNVRVVEDKGSLAGYRLDLGPFPGWEALPSW